MKTCPFCGGEVPPNARTGRKRKWCSENCRKRFFEVVRENRGTCIDCGDMLGKNSSRNHAKRCRGCQDDRRAISHAARMITILYLWTEGQMSGPAIASAMGTTRATIQHEICRMRAAGVEVPYRRTWTEESLERLREGGRKHAPRRGAAAYDRAHEESTRVLADAAFEHGLI